MQQKALQNVNCKLTLEYLAAAWFIVYWWLGYIITIFHKGAAVI